MDEKINYKLMNAKHVNENLKTEELLSAPLTRRKKERFKDDPRVGKRVELLDTTDPYTELKPGDTGTVELVDDSGTVFVQWDDGSTLGLIPGEDHWRYIDE